MPETEASSLIEKLVAETTGASLEPMMVIDRVRDADTPPWSSMALKVAVTTWVSSSAMLS